MEDKNVGFNDLWFFLQKSSGGIVKNEMISNKELAKEWHKTVIRKFEK